MLARQAPMAGDLRRVLAARSTTTELERIGDHAADIAKTIAGMGAVPALDIPPPMSEMADRARTMLNNAVAAFATRDVAGRARPVRRMTRSTRSRPGRTTH